MLPKRCLLTYAPTCVFFIFIPSGQKLIGNPGECLTQKKPKCEDIDDDRTEDCESFFNLFNPSQLLDADEDIDETVYLLSII